MYKNKSDQAANARRHYARNSEQIKARAVAHNRVRKEQYRRDVDVLKKHPCTDCGIEYPPYVMQFDHVRGKKLGNVATMVWNLRPWDLILEEIAKCELVCANCHAERTHQRGKPTDGKRSHKA
jgi:hypothetical protein